MKTLSLKNENIIDLYQPSPIKFPSLEGRVLKSEGQDLKLEISLETRTVIYDIRLRHEEKFSPGDFAKVDSENIQGLKREVIDQPGEESIDSRKILSELGLEYTGENLLIIDQLISYGIRPVKSNIEAFKASKNLIDSLGDKAQYRSLISLSKEGVDLGTESLQDLDTLLDRVEVDRREEAWFFSKPMDYKEAEEIAEAIYKKKMGRDIYDIIIALDREGMAIDRFKIEEILDISHKIYDLKSIENQDLIDFMDQDLKFNLDNLYRVKNKYTKDGLGKNSRAEDFEGISEVALEDLKELLGDLGLDPNQKNIEIARSFLVRGRPIVRQELEDLDHKKSKLMELIGRLNNENLTRALRLRKNIMEDDIEDILEDFSSYLSDEGLDPRDLARKLESLDDQSLIELIDRDQELSLENILAYGDSLASNSDLATKLVARSVRIIDYFERLGENPLERINDLVLKGLEPSLKNLYDLGEGQVFKEGMELDLGHRDFILREYKKARTTISLNTLKFSVLEDLDLEELELSSLNKYIVEKREVQKTYRKFMEDIREFKALERHILPLALKNQEPMNFSSLGELRDYILKGPRLEPSQSEKETGTLRKKILEEIGKGPKMDQTKLAGLLSSYSGNSFGEPGKNKEGEKGQDSAGDLIIKLPVSLAGREEDISIIIPDKSALNDGTMDFSLLLQGRDLSILDLGFRLSGHNLRLNYTNSQKVISRIEELRSSLKTLGYSLELGSDL